MTATLSVGRKVLDAFCDEWMAPWNAHDRDGLVDLTTADVVWDDRTLAQRPFRDGKLAHYQAAYDITDMMRQLGPAPTPGRPNRRRLLPPPSAPARLTLSAVDG